MSHIAPDGASEFIANDAINILLLRSKELNPRRFFLFLFLGQLLRRSPLHLPRRAIEEIKTITLAKHVHPNVVNRQRLVHILFSDI